MWLIIDLIRSKTEPTYIYIYIKYKHHSLFITVGAEPPVSGGGWWADICPPWRNSRAIAWNSPPPPILDDCETPKRWSDGRGCCCMGHVDDIGSKIGERSYIDGVIVGRSDMERGGRDPEDVTVAGGGCGSSRVAKCACTYESSFCKLTTCFF